MNSVPGVMQLLSKWALAGFSGGSSTPAGEKTEREEKSYKLCDPLVHTSPHFHNNSDIYVTIQPPSPMNESVNESVNESATYV